jgi:hypothetical protein
MEIVPCQTTFAYLTRKLINSREHDFRKVPGEGVSPIVVENRTCALKGLHKYSEAVKI